MDIFDEHQSINTNLFLYHYTKFDTAVNKIIVNNTLMFNTFDEVNDPKESKKWGIGLYNCKNSDDDLLRGKINEINEKLRLKWKVLCMVSDLENDHVSALEKVYYRGYSHPRMWDQYAENHKGVCLIFDKNKLSKCIYDNLNSEGLLYFGNVIYDNFNKMENNLFQFDCREVATTDLDTLLEDHLKEYYKALFFLKRKDWENENEWRYVLYNESDDNVFVDYKGSLLGIIFGCDCVSYSKHLPFFKNKQIRTGVMCWDRGHPGISELF